MRVFDLKDRKLLAELDTNSRQPYSTIAQRIGLSKDAVASRIGRLQLQGVIKQFHTVIDTGKLGYTLYRVYINFRYATPKQEQEMIVFLQSSKLVTWLCSIDGSLDVALIICSQSLQEAHQLLDKFKSRYQNYIEELSVNILASRKMYPRSYLTGKLQPNTSYTITSSQQPLSIDPVDLRLLSLLSEDSRTSVLSLSEALSITTKTVTSRIKNLERQQVIVGYRVHLDREKIGYQHFKLDISLHNTTPQKMMRIREFIKNHPSIVCTDEVLGGRDVELEVETQSLETYRMIINELKNHYASSIKDLHQLNYYEDLKNVFLPVLVAK